MKECTFQHPGTTNFPACSCLVHTELLIRYGSTNSESTRFQYKQPVQVQRSQFGFFKYISRPKKNNTIVLLLIYCILN